LYGDEDEGPQAGGKGGKGDPGPGNEQRLARPRDEGEGELAERDQGGDPELQPARPQADGNRQQQQPVVKLVAVPDQPRESAHDKRLCAAGWKLPGDPYGLREGHLQCAAL
jgi:hypothetical protein